MKRTFVFLLLLAAFSGCRTTGGQVSRAPGAPPSPDLGRLAIAGFENLTDYVNADIIVTSVLWTEIQSRGVPILSPDEVSAAAAAKKMDFQALARQNKYDEIGRVLGVDHLLTGKVIEFQHRQGLTEQTHVGLTVVLISAKETRAVWSASYATSPGSSFSAAPPLTGATIEVCRKMADDLTRHATSPQPRP